MQAMSVDPAVIKDWIFPIIEAGAALAAIILVLMVRAQMKQTDKQLKMTQDQVSMSKQQMESTIRPWLGATGAKIVDERHIGIPIKNYGSIPTTSAETRVVIHGEMMTEDAIRSSAHTKQGQYGVIFPDQTKTIRVEVSDIVKARTGEAIMFIGFLMEYKYANGQTGAFGIIVRYDPMTDGFNIETEWAK